MLERSMRAIAASWPSMGIPLETLGNRKVEMM